MHINGFRFPKMPCFLIYNNKIRICIKVLVKKVYQYGCRISIVSVTPKKAEMAPFWEKRGILHLSYLLNESGDPNYFFFFHYVYIMKFNPGKFEEIFISRTITDELPQLPNDRKSLCEGCFQSHVKCEIENFLSPTQFAYRERESCRKALL